MGGWVDGWMKALLPMLLYQTCFEHLYKEGSRCLQSQTESLLVHTFPASSSVLSPHPALPALCQFCSLSWELHLAPECSETHPTICESTMLMTRAKMNTDIPSTTEARLDKGNKREKATNTGSHFSTPPCALSSMSFPGRSILTR